MKTNGILIAPALMISSGNGVAADDCASALDFDKRRLAGDEVVNLCDAYQRKLVLIVNTASKCASTGQYEGLEALYRRYKDRGFVVGTDVTGKYFEHQREVPCRFAVDREAVEDLSARL